MARRVRTLLLGFLTVGVFAAACDGEPDDIPDGDGEGGEGGAAGSGDGDSGGRGPADAGGSGGTGGTGAGGSGGGPGGLGGFGGEAVHCPETQLLCGDECVTVSSDRDHCGDCESPCDDSELCVSGACELSCPPGMLACSNSCIDPRYDPEFCGATYCDETGTDAVACDMDEACVIGECRTFTREWNAGVRIDTASPDVGQEHSIAIDSSGNAVVIWRQKLDDNDETSYRVFASAYDASDKQWSAPDRLDDANTLRVRNLDVAMSASGDAMAVWVEGQPNSADPNRVMAATLDGATQTWGPAVRVNEQQGNPAAETNSDTPQVTMDAAGNAIVFWGQATGSPSRSRIFRNTFGASSGTFAGPVLIASQTGASGFFPRVTSNDAGGAAAIWGEYLTENDNATYVPVVVEGSVDGSGWASPEVARQDAANRVSATTVVGIDDDGDVLIAWNAFTTATSRIGVVTRLKEAGTWEDEAAWFDADTAIRYRGANLAMNRDGAAVVVTEAATWLGGSNYTNHRVLAARFASGTWSGLELISGLQAANQRPSPTVGLDASLGAFAVWVSGTNAETSRYSTDIATWTGVETVNDTALSSGTVPLVVVSPSGTALAAWVQLEGADYHLYVARFD